MQVEHPCEAPDLGGVSDRETRPLQGGDHGEGQVPVQEEVHCQQC